ncbi:uncharacterized protein LOC104919177 [Larimichthys crocea]|uniref:uncharacterized protein LOC104919177 n=1 Tax=Larimichthys crocea TaxID=215358 RepID=UPI000901A8C6|nr:uncharacterized protein LOC104919177 [Larimichthys crocea]
MDKNCDTAENVASSKAYVLCEMPAEWTSLPVHADPESSPSPSKIAVYRKRGRKRALVYEGYICPPAHRNVPMSKLQPPPRQESFGMKYQRLMEKIRAEAEAQTKITLEQQMNKNSSTNVVVAEEEPSIMPGHEDSADESKLQKKEEAIATSETNTDCPLPLVTFERRESLLPAPSVSGTEEVLDCFEPLEDTREDTRVKYTGVYSENSNYPLPLETLERKEMLLPVPPVEGFEFLDGFEPFFFEPDHIDTPEESFLMFLETI